MHKYIALGKCASCSKVEVINDQLNPVVEALMAARSAGYSRAKLRETLDEVYGINKISKDVVKTDKPEYILYHSFRSDVETVKFISKDSLIDIKFCGYSALCYYKNTIKLAQSVFVNQYEVLPISEVHPRAVIKLNNPIFTKVPIKNYQPKSGYMNVPNKYYEPGDSLTQDMLKKVIIDNKLTFKYTNLDMVFYDIETYNIRAWNEVPTLNEGQIGLISLVHISNPENPRITVKLFYLQKHRITKANVLDQLSECPIDNIQYIECEHEYSMAYNFFKALSELKSITLVAGFNSSSSRRDDDTAPGYDLPFLIKKCQSKLNPHKHRVKIGLTYGTQYTKIDELPNIYFIDMQVLLNNSFNA